MEVGKELIVTRGRVFLKEGKANTKYYKVQKMLRAAPKVRGEGFQFLSQKVKGVFDEFQVFKRAVYSGR